MARLKLFALVVLVAGGLASPPVRDTSSDIVKKIEEIQAQWMQLFSHVNEPVNVGNAVKDWTLEDHFDNFKNVSAVKKYTDMLEHGWILPRGVPFAILNEYHQHEVVTLFHVLFSAKDIETLYHAAWYLRDKVNENLFVYVLNTVMLHHPETKGIVIPSIYEVLPTYFSNAEIVATAHRLNAHTDHHIHFYPSCYKWEENIIIKWNETIWPYFGYHTPLWYYTEDMDFNAMYYYNHLSYPSWLGSETVPLKKYKRGEWTWYIHRTVVNRFYMNLLSDGLGEIPELGYHVVEKGFNPGLVHFNGIPFPVRNDHYHIDQPVWTDALEEIAAFELRIHEMLDKGYYVDVNGQNVKINYPESVDVLWNIIEANADSPNTHYYRDFISIWKKVLGNSIVHEHYHNSLVPLVVPSALELPHTALRDPAFYMIWKRVLDMFWSWQKKLPHYTKEELGCSTVSIDKVHVDKLVTYFEKTHMNISSLLYMTEHERNLGYQSTSVLVEYPRLNHKVFTVKLNVNSAMAKKVSVSFFLAPKYDSHGHEIPLNENSKNFILLDQFIHELPAGESVIVRDSTYNTMSGEKWEEGKIHKNIKHIDKLKARFTLPKGHVNGMPFVLLVHIIDYLPPSADLLHTPEKFNGFGLGTFRYHDKVNMFPLDRPLHPWQVKGLSNVVLQDVLIYHKHTPEIFVNHHE